MTSQRITIDILNHAGADLYARTGEGDSRAVIFTVTSGEDSVEINNPVVEARIVKPDNTFTITTAALISGPDEPQEFRFYIPEAASQVSGIGSYDIRIQEDGEENIIYSAQGRFICDDNMLTDEMIESVAEVDGLIFPDDFLTDEDMGDYVTDDELTTKLSDYVTNEELATELSDYATTDYVDKAISHIQTLDIYSTTEKIVGTWIDGRPVYEKTFTEIPLGNDGTYTLFSSGIDIAFLVSCYYVNSGTGTLGSPSYISRYGAGGNCSQFLELENHSLTVWNNSTTSILWTATIRYVKTV